MAKRLNEFAMDFIGSQPSRARKTYMLFMSIMNFKKEEIANPKGLAPYLVSDFIKNVETLFEIYEGELSIAEKLINDNKKSPSTNKIEESNLNHIEDIAESMKDMLSKLKIFIDSDEIKDYKGKWEKEIKDLELKINVILG